MLAFQTDYDENTGDQVLTCFLLPQLEGSSDEGRDSPMRGRLIRGAFGDSEDLYRKDKDSGEDGGWFDGPGDSGWDPADVKTRESIIKFAGVDTEEEEMEREPREMVRQKTPHPKELKAKAHKLFGSPTKSADNTGVSFEDNGEFINGIQKKEDEAAMEEQDEGIPQQDLEDEEDEETYKGEHGETVMMIAMTMLKNRPVIKWAILVGPLASLELALLNISDNCAALPIFDITR